MLPATVQTAGVVDAKATGSPELAVAERVDGPPVVPEVGVAAKPVIVWPAFPTVYVQQDDPLGTIMCATHSLPSAELWSSVRLSESALQFTDSSYTSTPLMFLCS